MAGAFKADYCDAFIKVNVNICICQSPHTIYLSLALYVLYERAITHKSHPIKVQALAFMARVDLFRRELSGSSH